MESVNPILEFNKTCVSYTKQTMAVKYVSAAIDRNTITAIMDLRVVANPLCCVP